MDYTDIPRWFKREKKVATVLHRLFFRNLRAKLFITLVGNNNMVFLKMLYPHSLFAEYQHGIFWCPDDARTLRIRRLQKEFYNKETYYLLYGKGFARIHASCPDARAHPDNKIKVIGSYFPVPDYTQKRNEKTILYTLQNIDMKNNEAYYQTIRTLISENADFLQQNGYTILFKNHPRYERTDVLSFDDDYSFVSFIDDNAIMELSEQISIHITSKSTTALDAALHSIPTIFVDMLGIRSPKKIFFDLYRYPLNDFRITEPKKLKKLLHDLEETIYYQSCSQKVYAWAREYYQDFNEKIFLELLKEAEYKMVSKQ